jgi:hypothetical protein
MKSRFLAFILVSLSLLPLTGRANSPKVGAYNATKIDKAEVKAAAKFAVKEESKREKTPIALKAIVAAHEQVVAGMNYRVTLSVNKSGRLQNAEAVIFRGLDSHYELKSWQLLKP